jgi:hypothetical protein
VFAGALGRGVRIGAVYPSRRSWGGLPRSVRTVPALCLANWRGVLGGG